MFTYGSLRGKKQNNDLPNPAISDKYGHNMDKARKKHRLAGVPEMLAVCMGIQEDDSIGGLYRSI